MREITEQEKINDVLNSWLRIYKNDISHEKTTNLLKKIDWDIVTKKEIDTIIGNTSWTDNTCDYCNKHRKKLIIFNHNSGETETALCERCLKAGLVYLT